MNIDRSGEHISVELTPDFFEEYLSVNGGSSILSQVLEEVKLFRREFYIFAIFCHQTFRCINFDISDEYIRCFIGNTSPPEREYACDEFFEIEWFPQVVIGSDIEPSDHVFCCISRGQKEYGGSISRRPEFLAEGESVFSWEVDIENDDIEMLCLHLFHPHDPIKSDFYLKRFESQVFSDILCQYAIIFDQEYFHIFKISIDYMKKRLITLCKQHVKYYPKKEK